MSTCLETNDVLSTEPRFHGSPECRINAALGQKQGRLPGVTEATLQRYYEHLAVHLSFPFAARYPEPAGLHSEVLRSVTVIGIRKPTGNSIPATRAGIVARAATGAGEIELPLADLEVDAHSPNYELVEDYWYWFWNWQ
jgi:hypothetical protein